MERPNCPSSILIAQYSNKPLSLYFVQLLDGCHNLLIVVKYFYLLQKDSKSSARECEGQEVLRVRAYGSLFFTLGINIRCSLFHAE